MGQAAPRQPSRVTVEEFLVWDDGTDTRHELVCGEIFAMAPPTEAHGTIVTNLAAALRSRLRPPCRAVTEAGVRLAERDDTYYQADLLVTCTPAVPKTIFSTNPTVIFEVLSPSTASYDRGTKIPDYRAQPSIQEIVMVSSSEYKAEVWHRTADGWVVADVAGNGAAVHLASLDIVIPLELIYDGVALEVEKTG
jgi:Uma2 family endonuclease